MTQLFESWNLQQRRNAAGLKTFSLVLGLIVALAGTSVQAGIINVAAKGSGWCSSDAQYVSDDCADSNLNLHSNTFAGTNSGVGGDTHRNWFAFDLPAWSTISSASIFIWNDVANINTNPNAVFNLYKALDLSFEGLTNDPSPSLGSVLVDTANAGTTSGYVEIELNAAGIAALTASLGNQFIFGGNNDNGEQIFGFTSGRPIAYLVLVPAPATIPLLGLALVAAGFSRRRRESN